MTLTRILLSSVAFVAITVAGNFSANATSSAPGSAQVLGGASSDAAPGTTTTTTTTTTSTPPAVAPGPVPTAPGDMPPPPSASAVTEVPSVTPTPDTASLSKPSDLTAPLPGSTTPGSVSAPPSPELLQPVTGTSDTKKIVADKKSDQPDAYYDSRLNPPTGPLANAVGPRKVDPTQEPGSKYVVAKKNRSATDTESLLVAASRALDLDRNDAALEMFDQLYKRNPRDPRILMGRAVAQQKLGQDDVAIVSYQALLDIDPKNSDAVVNMMGLLQKQYPAVALRRLTDLQGKFPTNPGIAAQLGMTYAQMGNNKDAIRSLSMADSLDPTNAQHSFNMAVIFDRAGDKTNAMKYYTEALQTDAVYGASRSIPREKVYDRLAQLRK
ncbi:MAG: occlusion derived virus envelope protein 66 [Micavibrio sp.]|nr:occlusion derived virus envelope protein 66 [Micavibrio sp.]